jgi:hypothetical protein
MYALAPLLDKLPLGPMLMQDFQEGQNIGINKKFLKNINSIGQSKRRIAKTNQPTNALILGVVIVKVMAIL